MQRCPDSACLSPRGTAGYWDLDLAVHDERCVAQLLVLLAVGEPGENWHDERYE